MNDDQLTNFVVVFKTGKLFEFDGAVNVLKEAGIPHFMREETSTGLSLAMSAAPTPGPGTCWSLLVPEGYISKAQDILSQLPFEIKTEAEYWDFGPKDKVKLGFKLYILLILLIDLIIIILTLLTK